MKDAPLNRSHFKLRGERETKSCHVEAPFAILLGAWSQEFNITSSVVVAGSHVRWAATPGGNLSLLINPKYYLESDFATVLAGAGGKVQVTYDDGKQPV